MRLTVIVTTYNSPAWLEKVLWGYSAQDHGDFEIIVGDDGSTDETGALLTRMRAETGMDIRHVWQRDDGFRKCRILNKAILHARSEYLVFTDGDCIPRRDFLAEHVRHAAPGHFLSGSYCKLPMATSEAITRDDILAGRCFDIDWLRAHGLPRNRKNLKLAAPPSRAGLLNRLTTARCNFKGSNGSVWLADAMKVNGFDERMAWGGLDREFGVRLRNAGVKPRHVRYNAICVHLDHSRGYRDEAMVRANKQWRVDVARSGRIETDRGIRQLVDDGYEAAA
ncbi:glycosyltransferase family 2 protein [Algiphilus sp.]|uniref:glycosyltransferase family 2 protein n=1 Tax=Algiphilus sp. TaxID=1872431 RepID=UPI0025C0849A|nr:glycosyltransferase family 2 protein [Algiphilus sp.]MCK5771578.1 glycosyltransferase family 2 protein [Algiphilus sp.]